jgi:hypothetical protein
MPSKQNDTDLEPLLHVELEHLGLIMDEAASTDNKALGLLAAIVATLIYIAQANFHITEWWHTFIVLSPFCLALICTGFAIWPRKYLGASPDIDARPQNLNLSRDALILQLLANTNLAAKRNNKINQQRWLFCVGAIVFLLMGAIVLFAIL